MKIEGRYAIGTIREAAEYMLADCYNTDWRGTDVFNNIKECDVAIYTNFEKGLSLSELVDSGYCSGWYGLKKIDTGFDTNVTDLISDYYGGYCASYGFIDDEDTKEDGVSTIVRMLMETLNMTEKCTETDILLWDFEPNKAK